MKESNLVTIISLALALLFIFYPSKIYASNNSGIMSKFGFENFSTYEDKTESVQLMYPAEWRVSQYPEVSVFDRVINMTNIVSLSPSNDSGITLSLFTAILSPEFRTSLNEISGGRTGYLLNKPFIVPGAGGPADIVHEETGITLAGSPAYAIIYFSNCEVCLRALNLEIWTLKSEQLYLVNYSAWGGHGFIKNLPLVQKIIDSLSIKNP